MVSHVESRTSSFELRITTTPCPTVRSNWKRCNKQTESKNSYKHILDFNAQIIDEVIASSLIHVREFSAVQRLDSFMNPDSFSS